MQHAAQRTCHFELFTWPGKYIESLIEKESELEAQNRHFFAFEWANSVLLFVSGSSFGFCAPFFSLYQLFFIYDCCLLSFAVRSLNVLIAPDSFENQTQNFHRP